MQKILRFTFAIIASTLLVMQVGNLVFADGSVEMMVLGQDPNMRRIPLKSTLQLNFKGFVSRENCDNRGSENLTYEILIRPNVHAPGTVVDRGQITAMPSNRVCSVDFNFDKSIPITYEIFNMGQRGANHEELGHSTILINFKLYRNGNLILDNMRTTYVFTIIAYANISCRVNSMTTQPASPIAGQPCSIVINFTDTSSGILPGNFLYYVISYIDIDGVSANFATNEYLHRFMVSNINPGSSSVFNLPDVVFPTVGQHTLRIGISGHMGGRAQDVDPRSRIWADGNATINVLPAPVVKADVKQPTTVPTPPVAGEACQFSVNARLANDSPVNTIRAKARLELLDQNQTLESNTMDLTKSRDSLFTFLNVKFNNQQNNVRVTIVNTQDNTSIGGMKKIITASAPQGAQPAQPPLRQPARRR